MANLNRVIVLGNLTRDPELSFTKNHTPVCDLGLAVNERRKQGDEWIESPVFVDVTLFGRIAELAGDFLHKGSLVLIEGRLRYESWHQDDGQKRSRLKVIGENMQLLGAKPEQDEIESTQSVGDEA